MPAGSSDPYTITGISSADNAKDFSVYELTQYDNSLNAMSLDGTVSLNDGLNHAVYLKGLTPGQTGTVAKTGLYGVKLAKTQVPANSGAVEVVIATGYAMAGVTPLSTGATFGSPLAVNTDLEYQAIGTIATTGIVFNDTRYNGTTTAASAGSLRFGVGGTTAAPDKFLYIQIPKTISSFHTAVVPAPEEVNITTVLAAITPAKNTFTVTFTDPTMRVLLNAASGANISLLTAATPAWTALGTATLQTTTTTTNVVLYYSTAKTSIAGTVAMPGCKITAAALKRKGKTFTIAGS
ncbi:hypothetical protein AGMMS50267_16790 [Spirochaetia bacterium]|nr:hypothetical protein AGMMS50267_16790 [Spirochaetia bacterium]